MIRFDKRVLKDVQRIQQKLVKAAQDIKIDTENNIQEVGTLGFNFAFNLAPHYTGALKRAMRLHVGKDFFMIVSSQPSGDRGFPTHVLFDLGLYPNPRLATSLGFMKQTAIFLETEFTERLGIAIHHSIEKIGGKV